MKISEVNLNTNKFDMLLFTKEEFKMVTGTDLSIVLEEDDDNSNIVNRTINDACMLIKQMVMEYSYKDLLLFKDELYYNGLKINNEQVIRYIKLAGMEQLTYNLVNGDLSLRSGIGLTKKMFNAKDKKKVTYAPRAKALLMEAGLLGGLL
jgi:hypothetical protein